MIPQQMQALIKKLTEKSQAKLARWTKTSSSSAYQLILGNATIIVDNFIDRDLKSRAGSIKVVNKQGEVVDEIIRYSTSAQKADYDQLKEIHVLAKRTYLRADETYDALLKELDSSDDVGQSAIEDKDVKDDLPF